MSQKRTSNPLVRNTNFMCENQGNKIQWKMSSSSFCKSAKRTEPVPPSECIIRHERHGPNCHLGLWKSKDYQASWGRAELECHQTSGELTFFFFFFFFLSCIPRPSLMLPQTQTGIDRQSSRRRTLAQAWKAEKESAGSHSTSS